MGCPSTFDVVPQTRDALSCQPHFCFYVGTPDLLESRSHEKASYVLTFKEQDNSSSSKVLVLLDGFDKTRTFSPDVNDTLGVEFHWRDLTSDLPFVSPPRIYFVFDLCESSRQSFLPSFISLLKLALGPQTVPSHLDYKLSEDFVAALNAIDADPTGKGDLAASFASLASELPPHLSPLHPGPDSAVLREFFLSMTDRTAWSMHGTLSSSATKQFFELVKMLASSGGPPPPPPETSNNNNSTRPKEKSTIPWYRNWMPLNLGSERPPPHDVEAVLIRTRWRAPRLWAWNLLGTGHEIQPLKTLLDAFKEVGYLDTQEGKVQTLVSLVEGQGTDPLRPSKSRPREVGLVVKAIRYTLALSTPTTPPPSLRDALTKLDRLKILLPAVQKKGNKELLAWLLDDADNQGGGGGGGGNLREVLNTANYIRGPSPENRMKRVWLQNYVLHTAVCRGDVDMVKLLLERGAKMLRDDEGRTPLMFARMLSGSRIRYHEIEEKVEVLEGWLRERELDSEYWDEPEEYALDASEGEDGFEFEISKGLWFL
ncbi:hypothetical protein NEUTE1DRAFT_129076 [Neurospora tetrasperma FGSC 2508]|uniref:Uncharacterized protein n=1 Tax=Neurospora tetrasperma (strain FGSC 2508 / ATCC MYA-4615 / P0657) TaxID=510951 RepID=F8MID2_NEUT8|nr:uncharacterized protein NEUTE1DRAFT_129076 [Neurospora tetrasperma FGSC 2508]EGO59786.1 hypothetical protein NEUTE1DRAFT_129076 [Neurospora tetrasperma FGSC 2508]EGZ73933.1 hypothetical protein NEUTE2DRAFT_149847 [Neurospora tetrasperma FGSC 2509]